MTDSALWVAAHPLYWLTGLPVAAALLGLLAWRAMHVVPPGRARVIGLSLFSAVLVALFLALADAVHAPDRTVAFDLALAQALSGAIPAGLLGAVSWLTHLGDRRWLAVMGVIVLAALAWRGRWRLAWAAGITMAGSGAINWVLKHLFQRARPDVGQSAVQVSGFSFPSGHTSASLAIYGFACYLLLRLLPARWHAACVAVTAALVVAIGVSRILLQVHFLSDVLAGLLVSALWLVLCISMTERWVPRR